MDKKPLLFVLFSLALTACGGGSSSSSNIVGSDSDQRITVTSEGIREDVSLSLYVNRTPTEENIISRDGQFAFEYLLSDGDTFEVNIEEPLPFNTECQLFNNGPSIVGSDSLDIRLNCKQLASVRGTISLQTAFQTDADINDINTDTANNNFFERAQEIRNDLPLQGFVSRFPFDAPEGNYSNFPDRVDFFKLDLEKDEVITLQSHGYRDQTPDADLELYNANMQLLARSTEVSGIIDEVIAPESASFFVVVKAIQGSVSYLLDFNTSTNQSAVDITYSSPVYARLTNSETGQIEQTVKAVQVDNATYEFEFINIPSGTYTLIGGSDIDNNAYLCELPETCGTLSSTNDPTQIDVGDDDVNNLDFSISLITEIPIAP